MIAGRQLFLALLPRAAGPMAGAPLLALGALIGMTAGLLAHQQLAAKGGPTPALLEAAVQYPASARYVIGIAFAWRALACVAVDDAAGWTQQLAAAGMTRDRYLFALAGAYLAVSSVLYLVSVSAWAVTLAITGHGTDAVHAALKLLPVALLWIGCMMAFATAMLGVTGRSSSAQGLMLLLLWGPVMLAMIVQPAEATALAGLIRMLSWLAPPAFIVPTLRMTSHLLLFTGMASLIGYILSVRLLRVR